MTKVSVEKIEMEEWSVEFPLDDIREQLRFEHNGVKMRLPYNAVLSYVGASPENGPAKLVGTFKLDVTKPEPSGLTQQEVDVWGLIRQAGDGGITYARLGTITEDAMAYQTLQGVVRSLVKRNLVEQCGKESRPGAPPRKLWRSVE